MDAVVFALGLGAIAFAVAAVATRVDRRLTLASALLFAVYLALDDLVTGLPTAVPALDFLPGDWNWEGKFFSIALAVGVIAIFGLSRDAVGLTLRQRNLKSSLVVAALYLPWAATLGLMFKPGLSTETLAFQATMPGIAEELALRGVAPALLLGLLRGKPGVVGVPWAVVAVSGILFGVWHALGYADGAFSFDVTSALLTGFGGLVACWLRFKSGSLLLPVVLHSAANVLFHLAPWLAGSGT